MYPGAPEVCDGLDNDCDFALPAGETDADGDGVMLCDGDCDDGDPGIYPGATELCDGLDNDCDGQLGPQETDDDGDGYSECTGDCDDGEPTVNPDQWELCDGLDNDCDGAPGPGEDDLDGDGWRACQGECNDDDATVYPGAPEICDGQDNDCNFVVPAGEEDDDGDGVPVCAGDCDDGDPDIYPGAPELCDGADNDCDGQVGPDETDGDGDGFTICDGDCDDGSAAVFPGADEECDGEDNDCDGDVDEEGCVTCPWVVDGAAVGSLELGTEDDPFVSIQDGVDAIDGDCGEVEVEAGTYDENVDLFDVTGSVVSRDGPEATVIDGAGDRVVHIQNANVEFSGFTIQGGQQAFGGGIMVWGGTVELSDNVVRHNSCDDGGEGAGLFAWNATLTIADNTFEANDCGYGGPSSGNNGGAMTLDDCAAEIVGNVIVDNSAGDAGGIYVENGPAYIYNNLIAFNLCDDSEPGQNQLFGGGGVVLRGDEVLLFNNLIVDNESGDTGGGVVMFETSGDSVVGNNVIVNNRAASGAGGLAFNNADEGMVWNNVFAHNDVAALWADGSDQFDIEYNDVVGSPVAYAGTLWDRTGILGNIATDPDFVSFTDDGDPFDDDFHLSPGSPCIDTGHPAPQLNDADGSRSDMGAYGGPYGAWP